MRRYCCIPLLLPCRLHVSAACALAHLLPAAARTFSFLAHSSVRQYHGGHAQEEGPHGTHHFLAFPFKVPWRSADTEGRLLWVRRLARGGCRGRTYQMADRRVLATRPLSLRREKEAPFCLFVVPSLSGCCCCSPGA